MRYKIDNEGYIASVYFNCHTGSCNAYTGTIPDGYSSLEEWAENANIQAYKIVEGNLVFDANRCAILEAQFDKETEDNRYVCHKEISNLTNLVKSDSAANYERSATNRSNLIEVTDSNKFASTYIELRAKEDISNKVHIRFNNGNLFTNEATSQNESGIYFVVNPDRTISISGKATEDIEYNIAGTFTNTKPILALKKGVNYYMSSGDQIIRLYNYDGVDRTEIYSGYGGLINFTDEDKIITHIVVYIPSETTVNETLKPMLNLGETAQEYITYQGNEAIVYLGSNTFTGKDIITIDDWGTILKGVQYPSSNLEATEGLKPSIELTPSSTLTPSNQTMATTALYPSNETYAGYTKLKILETTNMPFTYLDLTYMYCMENVELQVAYPNTKKYNDLTGYETPNGGFAIDEEGNMYCNNATIEGSAIVNGGNFRVDKEGNMTCNNANVNGVVNSKHGNIGGWTINNNGLTNGTVFLNSDGSSTIYTVADLIIMRGYIMEIAGFGLSPAMIKHYDLNGDGVVNAQDFVLLQNLIGISMS